MRNLRYTVAACALCALTGCLTTPRPAPVIEKSPQVKQAVNPAPKPQKPESDWRPDYYTVQKSETLYSIALEHGLDYKDLAQWNNIDNPAQISAGQQLRLTPPADAVVTAPLATTPGVEGKPVDGVEAKPLPPPGFIKSEPKAVKLPYSDQALAQLQKPETARAQPEAAAVIKPETKPEAGNAASSIVDGIDWSWPATGKIISGYSENASLKGMDIAGKMGQPVFASASGKVIYSGANLRGYGKLIIIKHNEVYFSAYAHNSEILVKEGQTVVKGQKIAEMGNTDAEQVKLHFEIRRLGKPVDPGKYLPGQTGEKTS
ncbi:MAG: peptidoglycan DD-metalloendopeptidase family protein [Burkholderiales bacterium]